MLRARAVAVGLTLALATSCSSPSEPPPDAPAGARTMPEPRPDRPEPPPRLVRSGPPIEVTVMQYNIQFASAGLDGVARDIRKVDPDIVLLNEIDDRRRTGGPQQAAYLARRLGMNVAYDPNGAVRDGIRGNAVLTKLDIAYVRRYALPRPDGTEQRGLMRVTVTRGRLQLNVWTTHLNPDVGTRAQARRVRTVVGVPPCTTILAGDLNVRPYRDPPQMLGEHLGDVWRYVGKGPGGTNRAGTRRIDYLYFRNTMPVSAVVEPRRHSDHHALVGAFLVDPADNC